MAALTTSPASPPTPSTAAPAAVTLDITDTGSVTNNGTFQVADSTNTVTLREESGTGTFTFSGNDIDENGNTINLARVSYSPAVALAGGESIVLDDDSTFTNSITVDGTFDTQTHTLSAAGQTLTVNGTGELAMANGGGVDVGAFTSTGTVTNPGAGSSSITASGDVAISGTLTNPAINTLTMTGTAFETLNAAVTIGNVEIDGDIVLANDLVMDGDFTITSGELDANTPFLRHHPDRRLDEQRDLLVSDLYRDHESDRGNLDTQ